MSKFWLFAVAAVLVATALLEMWKHHNNETLLNPILDHSEINKDSLLESIRDTGQLKITSKS